MENIKKQVAFLCTGDEIINGDVLDTNAPYFAQKLIDHNFVPGIRLAVSDDQKAIESAIHYLLKDHAVLITLGGLGPTSDDRTRFAVAAALNQTLKFDTASWECIIDHFKQFNREVTENNRKQCLFPDKADIYPNTRGTASACCITQGEQLIFMLPGPPNECCPIFNYEVLPRLLKTDFQQTTFRRSWMLLGTCESKIAKSLDNLLKNRKCNISYRCSAPYLEVKLHSIDKNALENLAPQIETQIQDTLISCNGKTASDILFEYLQRIRCVISIDDRATQGRLATRLMQPKLYNQLFFNDKETDIKVILYGLEDYWQGHTVESTSLSIVIQKSGKIISNQMIKIPVRGDKTLAYAVEYACQVLFKKLTIILNPN